MPKLLIINSCANWGSTGRIAEQIGILSQQKGWDVYMAFGGSSNPSQLKTIKIGNKIVRVIHYLLYRFLDMEGCGSIISTMIFVRKLKMLNPDIIHLHNIHGHYLNYRILFRTLKKINKPVVWTFHDTWAMTGHCYLLHKDDCEKWKKECIQCVKKNKYALDFSSYNYKKKKEVFTSLENVTIITVSNWLASLVKLSFMKGYPLKTIYNGVDLEVFKPSNSGDICYHYKLLGKRIILGVATTWSNGKGLKDFFSLSKILDDEYQIVLIGLTEKQIKVLPNKIIGIRRTDSVKKLVAWYSLADVVLSLSYGESMGLTPVEGMACGTPAIVYDNTAQPELVTEDTGFVVKQGDVFAVKKAIDIIVKSKDQEKMKEACIKRANCFFDKNERYDDYLRLYEQLLPVKEENTIS